MAKRQAPPGFYGFTLVELLTVIAIVAILATLLSSAIAGAKRKARQAACTSNLRQISLAFNMYVDDEGARPANLPYLVSAKYLRNPLVLRCPEDKTGNWGGLVERASSAYYGSSLTGPSGNDPGLPPMERGPVFPYSYLHPLPWDNEMWNKLMKDATAGIAACQAHGLGKPGFPLPKPQDYQGLVLRGQRDGAVVRRQVFWDKEAERGAPGGDFTGPVASSEDGRYPWQLFTDQPLQ